MAVGLRIPLPPPPRKNAGDDEFDPGPLRRGDVLEGRYQIEDPLDSGGAGVVYRALHLRLDRQVAVKVLHKESDADPSYRPRFEREARTLAALHHPHIVAIQDYGLARGRPFLVLELLSGESLRGRMDRSDVRPKEALRVVEQVLHALAHAHNQGVIHRDLKPGNIFLQKLPTQPDLVKLLDFGFVKLGEHSHVEVEPTQLTSAGTTFGTPAYMSPEHALGGTVDERSDIYALGVILYEMINGSKPFDGGIEEIFRGLAGEETPPLDRDRSDLTLSEPLRKLVDKAMHKHPKDRFQTAEQMLLAIREVPEHDGFKPDELSGAGASLSRVRESMRVGAMQASGKARGLMERASEWRRSNMPARFEQAERWFQGMRESLRNGLSRASARLPSRTDAPPGPDDDLPSLEQSTPISEGHDRAAIHTVKLKPGEK